jgi:hydroxypyruvate isomerase
MPRLAANLAYLFAERPFLDRFGAAAAAGFTAVELQLPYEHPPSAVKAELRKHGLTMLGINTPASAAGESGLAAVPGRESEFALLFRHALDYVVAIGGRQVHVLAGVVTPEQRPAAEIVFIRNLMSAGDLAAKQGITLLIEPLNPRDRPGYYLSRVEHAADIIAKVERTSVRMQFDFYHAQIAGGDLITRFGKHLPVIGHAQIAAVPSRHEPDEGEVDYREIFAVLDRLGYRGYVGAEYRPRGRTEDGLAWGRPYGLKPSDH